MMDISFNMNGRVRVRLNQKGIDIMRHQHDELNNYIRSRGGKGLRPFSADIDDEGYTSFQMWDLMERFGEHMTLGSEPPFHLEVIICGGDPINKAHGGGPEISGSNS